uniref:STAS domain-containing protein n=1 Tax=Panagrellus redivivus TaxID=6233 RepID=A0A7E4W595_PANRE
MKKLVTKIGKTDLLKITYDVLVDFLKAQKKGFRLILDICDVELLDSQEIIRMHQLEKDLVQRSGLKKLTRSSAGYYYVLSSVEDPFKCTLLRINPIVWYLPSVDIDIMKGSMYRSDVY